MQKLAIASVPMQRYEQIYSPQQALRRGTIFAQLDMPWAPETAEKGGGPECANR